MGIAREVLKVNQGETTHDRSWANAHLRELGIAPDLYRLKPGEDRFGLKLPSEGGIEVIRAIVLSLGRPEFVRRVERFHCKRDDLWLTELSALTEIEELNLSSCAISGEAPLLPLAQLKKLRTVLLSDCSMTDEAIASLIPAEGASAIETLSFWRNRGVTNASLALFAKLPQLKMLCLSETRVVQGCTAVRELEKLGVAVEF